MIMSASSFLSLALGCFLLVLAVVPHVAHGLSRGSTLSVSTDTVASTTGICATSVTTLGYQCQEFDVVTQDGYILKVQRIPEGRAGGGGGSGNKQPVLLQHGVLVDGRSWLLNLPEEDLPLILADNGFDVWIANTRGTQFSRRHTSLDPANKDFWNWTWDELATFDLPATFDFIHEQTGKKINYVGHSLGTLTALAALSEGRLVDKMQSAVLLSPIAYISHTTTALVLVMAKDYVGEIAMALGLADDPLPDIFQALCHRPGVDCYDLLVAFTGENCCLNSSTIDLFLKNSPQSTSVKNMVHLSQMVRDGVLAKFNHGYPSPPVYNLSNIPHDLPMFLSYGGNDALSDKSDLQFLLDNLKLHDASKLTVQFIEEYGHADFIMGVNAKDKVFGQVLSFFKSHQ
ncbi:hypothetical protein BT93_A2291 [Corymbia citriodora subsp. variegata]|nr:hypothetical protein BT93_A2291 [Corymbia citriodora subsp. variegata]